MSTSQEELMPDFVIRHLLHSALSQVGLPNTQVSRDAYDCFQTWLDTSRLSSGDGCTMQGEEA